MTAAGGQLMMAFRRGELYRFRDPSGVSGTGVVAQLVQFSDGSVAIRWLGKYPATTVWSDIDSLLEVHGHLGASEVRWVDPDPFDDEDGSTPAASGGDGLTAAAASLGQAWERHDDPMAGHP